MIVKSSEAEPLERFKVPIKGWPREAASRNQATRGLTNTSQSLPPAEISLAIGPRTSAPLKRPDNGDPAARRARTA